MRQASGQIVRRKPSTPTGDPSAAQLLQRQHYGEGVEAWRALSDEQRADWDAVGKRADLGGFHAFMKAHLLDTGEPPPPPPPPPPTEFLYDFGPPLEIGERPPFMTNIVGNPSIQVLSNAGALNGRECELIDGAVAFLDLDETPGSDDYEILARTRFFIFTRGRLALRAGNLATGGTFSGYYLVGQPSLDRITLRRRTLDGSEQAIAQVPFFFSDPDWFYIRFRIVGADRCYKRCPEFGRG